MHKAPKANIHTNIIQFEKTDGRSKSIIILMRLANNSNNVQAHRTDLIIVHR